MRVAYKVRSGFGRIRIVTSEPDLGFHETGSPSDCEWLVPFPGSCADAALEGALSWWKYEVPTDPAKSGEFKEISVIRR